MALTNRRTRPRMRLVLHFYARFIHDPENSGGGFGFHQRSSLPRRGRPTPSRARLRAGRLSTSTRSNLGHVCAKKNKYFGKARPPKDGEKMGRRLKMDRARRRHERGTGRIGITAAGDGDDNEAEERQRKRVARLFRPFV